MLNQPNPSAYRKPARVLIAGVATLAFSLAIGQSAFADTTTVMALSEIRETGTYALGKDIEITGGPSDGNSSYLGIFSGTLDGNGHLISGLIAPLFDVIAGTVSNLNLATNGAITTTAASGLTGVLAGDLVSSGRVTNVNVSGAITNENYLDSTGGLIGRAQSGSIISNSRSSVVVTSTDDSVGGLVGSVGGGTITGSGSTGDVHGVFGTGGLVGVTYGGTQIDSSFSSGNVFGTPVLGLGGLVGYLGDNGSVTNSATSGSVSSSGAAAGGTGGLIGRVAYGATIENDASSSTVVAAGGRGGGLIGGSYSSVNNSFATGNVSGSSLLGGLVGQMFADDEYSRSVSNSFATGNVTSSGDYVGGLVGILGLSHSAINNLASGVVTGVNQVGGLIGVADGNNTISNNSAVGNVVGTGEYGDTGGLIGAAFSSPMTKSEITNNSASGNVQGTNYTGGLIGENDANLRNNRASGSVSAAGNWVGGLVGDTYQGTTIANSVATGSVTGTNSGTLVGWGEVHAIIRDSIGTIGRDDDVDRITTGGVLGLNGPVGPTATGVNLLNVGETAWGQNSYINSDKPYILALKNSGFYTDTTPATTPPPASIRGRRFVEDVAVTPLISSEVPAISPTSIPATSPIFKVLSGDKNARATVADFVKLGVTGVTQANLATLLNLLKGVDLTKLDVNTINKNVKIANALLKQTKK